MSIGDGAVLASDSFLMKGEEVPPKALWGGNPAKKMRRHGVDLRTRRVDMADGSVVLGTGSNIDLRALTGTGA